MRKTEPSQRAPPTSNSTTASSVAAASGRKPTSSANAPYYLRYASAITLISTGPLVASRRVRNAPWPKRSSTYSTAPTRLSQWPRDPHHRYRTGLGPPAYQHHTPPATSGTGTPAWGRTTARQPLPLAALVPRRTHCDIRCLRFPRSEGGLL